MKELYALRKETDRAMFWYSKRASWYEIYAAKGEKINADESRINLCVYEYEKVSEDTME